MMPLDPLVRIADLETALRLVVVLWIVTVALLANLPSCDCEPRHECRHKDAGPTCPLHKVARSTCGRYHDEDVP